jgi:hypothetical protein
MNSPRRRALNCAWRIFASALFCAAASVSAQTIYKQVDAAGHSTFSDRPDGTPSASIAPVPALEVANALASKSAMSSRRAAIIDANEAARRLGQAELERKEGAERLPGEQAHGTDASAANQRYQQRQEDLRRAVIYAQRRSDETGRMLSTPP